MVNCLCSWLWPADRLGCHPGDPRYFTHVGRVAFISKDGHARLPHLRIKRVLQSVGHECFNALAKAYVMYVEELVWLNGDGRGSEGCDDRPAKTRIQAAAIFRRNQKLTSQGGFPCRCKRTHDRDAQAFSPVVRRRFDTIVNKGIHGFRGRAAGGDVSIRTGNMHAGNRPSLVKLHGVTIRQKVCFADNRGRFHEVVLRLNLPPRRNCA